MKALLVVILSIFLFSVAHEAQARDAQRCIRVGATNTAQSLTNTCREKVHVIWCHRKSGKAYRRGVCGQKGKFYQKETVLKPGQTHSNRYSIPKGTRISYGACYGGYYTAKQKGTSGRYSCKDKKKETSSNSRDRKDKYKKKKNDRYGKKKNDRQASKKSGKRGDAKGCIRIGRSSHSQTMTNTCRDKVEVVWCHNKKTKATRRGVCGRKGKFYQKHDVLKPGQVKKNQYSLPLGTRINFGACYGGYYTTKHSGLSGRYTCK